MHRGLVRVSVKKLKLRLGSMDTWYMMGFTDYVAYPKVFNSKPVIDPFFGLCLHRTIVQILVLLGSHHKLAAIIRPLCNFGDFLIWGL